MYIGPVELKDVLGDAQPMMATCMNGSPLDINDAQLHCCCAHSFIGMGPFH